MKTTSNSDWPKGNGAEQSCTMGASERKVQANRANSRKSTGPKTTRGKNISRFNALKHGGYTKELFITHGKHLPKFELYRTLADELQEQLARGAYLEDKVAIQMYVASVWRLESLLDFEFRVAEEGGALALSQEFPSFPRMLAQAIRACERAYDHLKELRLAIEEMEAAEVEADAAEAPAASSEKMDLNSVPEQLDN